jgi:hypothetical protein
MQADDDKQNRDSVTQDAINNAAISVEMAASKVIETAITIEQTANGVEARLSDVSKTQAQQVSDITAQRIAEVRAEVLRDNAELKAGQYKRL